MCAVSPDGQSDEEQCTILIGKGKYKHTIHRVNCHDGFLFELSNAICIFWSSGAPARPSDLKISNVTDSSAVVTWMPSNSNLEHRISVNNQSSALLRPGIYRCLLSG